MELLTIDHALALFTLVILEIVLGIDNIVFIAVLTERVEEARRSSIRRIGLAAALIMRIGLLFAITWLATLTAPWFTLLNHDVSGRDLVLLLGGAFLLFKATIEIHAEVEALHSHSSAPKVPANAANVVLQIMILDIVFSLDSVITAVGMTQELSIMVIAIISAVVVMMIFADRLSQFILDNPTVKMLALSFLMLIGVFLIADGLGKHIEKGYIYFAMTFSLSVEMLNMRRRRKANAALPLS